MVSFDVPVLNSPLQIKQALFRSDNSDYRLRAVILIPAMIGMLLGIFIGLYSGSAEMILASWLFDSALSDEAAFFQLFCRSFRFVFFAMLLSTSILGAALVPILAALRTFSLGCFTAAVLKELTLQAYLIAAVTFAIPTMLNLPAFFITCADGIEFSFRLWKRLPILQPPQPFLRRFALAILLCLAEATYTCYLLPRILLLIS